MVIFKVLLYPFAVLYNLITRFRNHLYNIGYTKSFRFQRMVIGVGNLNTGGSGKTPMIEYMIRSLKSNYHLATLSRGYGRRTKGIRFASDREDAVTLGDEPYQFFRKFGNEVHVVVAEERALAIPQILLEFPETDVILLDDAFQHRGVEPQFSVLITEFRMPFYHDFLLPAGRLRESRRGARRADIIIVTKCPSDLPEEKISDITRCIEHYSGPKPIFFSGVSYDPPVPFGDGNSVPTEVILVSGLADASQFESYAKSNFDVLHHFKFGDHHHYSRRDLTTLARFYEAQKGKPAFLTTEKDMVKLIGPLFQQEIQALPWFYLPVKTFFLKNGPDFDNLIIRSIKTSGQGT